jgi:hypothetical protein
VNDMTLRNELLGSPKCPGRTVAPEPETNVACLHSLPAKEPTQQRTEHETDLGRQGNIGGHADDDA